MYGIREDVSGGLLEGDVETFFFSKFPRPVPSYSFSLLPTVSDIRRRFPSSVFFFPFRPCYSHPVPLVEGYTGSALQVVTANDYHPPTFSWPVPYENYPAILTASPPHPLFPSPIRTLFLSRDV